MKKYQKLSLLIISVLLLMLVAGASTVQALDRESGAAGPTPGDYGVSDSSVDVSVGACSWSESGGSVRQVTFTLTGVSEVIVTHSEGGTWTITSSQTISLPEGHYTYTWTPSEGYRSVVDPNKGQFDVAACPPATASYQKDVCVWDYENSQSVTGVTLTLTNASFTITGVGTYETSQHVPLAPGHYEYSWTALSGYSGSGSGSFDLIDCEPEKGSASVSIGACSWDEATGSTFMATITLNNATLTINGETYEDEGITEIKLPCGFYTYTWTAKLPYQGGGEDSIDVEGCEPASGEVLVGSCDWVDQTSITPVTINVHGATLNLFFDNEGTWVSVGTFGEGTSSITLPTGSYKYSWSAKENYTGSGDGTFETLFCEPGKADASVSIGACTYSDNQSLTLVSITVNGAVLTIDGHDYTENAELKLKPGEYAYSWKSIEGYENNGEGILSVDSCEPKGGEDPSPDVAAGGSGPSLIVTLTPALLTASGIGLAWLLIKRRIKNI